MTSEEPILNEQQAQAVRAAAVEAGHIIMGYVGNPSRLEIFTKADGSKVTTADYAANDYLKEKLSQIAPGIPILSEEDDAQTQRAAMTGGTYWCIDPLDGTGNAVRNALGDRDYTYFGTLIALVRNGVPVFGVAHYPILGKPGHEDAWAAAHDGTTYFTNADGSRSFKVKGEGEAQLLTVQPPAWGVTPRVSRAFSDEPPERLGGRKVINEKLIGSRILHVAEGQADLGYFQCHHHLPGYWDIAALQAILRGAGGEVVSMKPDAGIENNGKGFEESRPLRYFLPSEDAPPCQAHHLAGHLDTLRQVGVPVSRFDPRSAWRDREPAR